MLALAELLRLRSLPTPRAAQSDPFGGEDLPAGSRHLATRTNPDKPERILNQSNDDPEPAPSGSESTRRSPTKFE